MMGESWEEKQGPRCVNGAIVIRYELYLLSSEQVPVT